MLLGSTDAASTDISLVKTLGNLETQKARLRTVRTMMLPEVSTLVSQSHYTAFTRLSANFSPPLKVKTKRISTLKIQNEVQERTTSPSRNLISPCTLKNQSASFKMEQIPVIFFYT